MDNRKILLFFLLIFFSLKCFPAVFVVTSNADAGPGTLRDALTQAAANGSTQKDYINFNLPDQSEAGRTIKPITALPNISSNLVIDGTTQPGANFGVSNAKVLIQSGYLFPGTGYNLFNLVNVDGFEMYGLYIRDFNSQFEIFLSVSVLYVEDCKNIQIGAPGKGNVFANDGSVFRTASESSGDPNAPPESGVENLKFYSNFCGFEPDGKTVRAGIVDPFDVEVLDITSCKGDIEIGGDDVADRNIFGNWDNYIDQFGPKGQNYYTSTILIKNNYFDYDIDGQPIPPPLNYPPDVRTAIQLATAGGGGIAPYTLNISNNKIQYPLRINTNHIKGELDFKGNSLLHESTYNGAVTLPQITCASDAAIVIGGVLPGEANTIDDYQLVPYSQNSMLLQHNSIYCVGATNVWYTNSQIEFLLPKIAITNITVTSAAGTATPLSTVELFLDDDCPQCQPLTYLATVTADAAGNWSYTGPITKGIIASATLNGFTSYFTTSATLNTYTLTQSSCGTPGALTGFVFSNSGGYQIKNSQGQVVSTNAEDKNLAPGTYTLTAQNGTCSTDYPFTIVDATPKIDNSNVHTVPPSCKQLGSITNLKLDNAGVLALDPNAYKITWFNVDNSAIVSNTLDLNNVYAGSYKLEVTYIKDNCTSTYGPILLANASGPNINQGPMVVTPSPCGLPTGSITNILVSGTSGTVSYIWWNGQQQTVGTGKDLLGQPPGTYQLQVSDESNCGVIYSTHITIPETNGIIMDETKAINTPATCGLNNGAVTGITVSGATQYTWADANGNTVNTTTPDLKNAGPGNYTLTASNSNCNKPSSVYTIQIIPPVTITAGSEQITTDQCDAHTGSIKGIQVQGGLTPYTFSWTDANGKTVSTAIDLPNAGAGSYTLKVSDGTGCQPVTSTYTLQNQDNVISPPAINDLQLCSAGDALLQVKAPSPQYAYRLYNSATAPAPIDVQASGSFKITANANSSFYVSQILGDCESTRTEAHITVGIASVDIANAFSPNGDGINDYWQIKNIENYPDALIQIFTRNGQKVFDSKGYGIPFDGTYKGQKLPAGVYYYIINLGNKCSLLSGSLTIIR